MRRILTAALMGALLAGCGAPVAQQPFPTLAPTAAPTNAPVAEPTLAPTAAPTNAPVAEPTLAPTAAPTNAPVAEPTTAPTLAPTAAPVQVKLPALDSGEWVELGQGNFLGNGYLTRVLYLPADEPANADFASNYAPTMVAVADAVVMTQEIEGTPLIWLQADRSGVSGDVLLWRPAAGVAPEAYMVALDPGSSFLLNLLPIGADGSAVARAIPLNWSDAASALRVVPVPAPDGSGEPQALAPSGDEYRAIGEGAVAYLAAADARAVAGALARAGDYAAAVARVFGEEQVRYLILQRQGDGAWVVTAEAPALTGDLVSGAGAPASLAGPHELDGLARAVIAHLQDPRGQGMAGHILVHRAAEGFARVTFMPADRMTLDPVTLFFGPGEGGYSFITAGTAFMPSDLDQLGIPQSVR